MFLAADLVYYSPSIVVLNVAISLAFLTLQGRGGVPYFFYSSTNAPNVKAVSNCPYCFLLASKCNCNRPSLLILVFPLFFQGNLEGESFNVKVKVLIKSKDFFFYYLHSTFFVKFFKGNAIDYNFALCFFLLGFLTVCNFFLFLLVSYKVVYIKI